MPSTARDCRCGSGRVGLGAGPGGVFLGVPPDVNGHFPSTHDRPTAEGRRDPAFPVLGARTGSGTAAEPHASGDASYGVAVPGPI